MLKLIRRYPKWISKKERKAGFQTLVLELQELTKDEFEKSAFEYFDFIAWMESKVQNVSFEIKVAERLAIAPHD